MRNIAARLASGLVALCVAAGAGATTATPTRTPAVPRCTGDCNGSQAVSLNEIITCVNIALGESAASVCTACDADGSGTVLLSGHR